MFSLGVACKNLLGASPPGPNFASLLIIFLLFSRYISSSRKYLKPSQIYILSISNKEHKTSCAVHPWLNGMHYDLHGSSNQTSFKDVPGCLNNLFTCSGRKFTRSIGKKC